MLWQKSPQYAGMPHEQYMQTAEGKKSQQAFQQWGQWQQNNMPTPAKPGTGSPGGITNRYDGAGFAADGTPIAGDPRMRGQQPASSSGNFSAYSPGQAQPQQNPYGTATPYGGKPQAMGPQWNQGGTNQQQTRQQPFQQYMTQGSPYGGGNQFQQRPAVDPNVANNPYANRPPPFQATTQNFDGTQSQMPNFQQRDAFISQINNQLGQMQGQSWQQPGMGAPQFNFPQMLGQAGQMAQQGFQNPFAPSGQGILGTLQQQSAPPMYSPPPAGMPQQGGSTGYGDRLANPDRMFTGDFRDRDGDRVDDRDQTGPGRPSGRQRTAEPAPVLRGAEDYPGPVSPGTAQPIPPQSQGTPPRSGAAPWGNADNFDSWWETRKDELLAKSREVRAAHPKRPDIWERTDWALRQHQDNRNVMAAGARMQENPRDNAAKQAYSDVVRQDQMKRSAEMRAANAAKPPQAKSMDDFRREDGSYDYEGARREWQAKQNAQRREYMKQPVAKRNAIYGSDANRRAYEIWMR